MLSSPAADMLPNERIQVLNINTGDRFETYIIEGLLKARPGRPVTPLTPEQAEQMAQQARQGG